MVPRVEFLPPGMSLTNQFTALLKLPVPCTVAVNCCVCPPMTLAALGATATEVIDVPGSDGPGSPPLLLQLTIHRENPAQKNKRMLRTRRIILSDDLSIIV